MITDIQYCLMLFNIVKKQQIMVTMFFQFELSNPFPKEFVCLTQLFLPATMSVLKSRLRSTTKTQVDLALITSPGSSNSLPLETG